MEAFSMWSVQGAVLCIAFFFAGVIDAVCGGGGLVTLPAFMAVGFPVHLISGTNQCAAQPGNVAALATYLRHGKVYWPAALGAAVLSLPGGYLGARLNLMLPARYLQIVMLVLLPIVAIIVLTKRNAGGENRADTLSRRRQVMLAGCIGFVVGAYQGFYGAGAGTFFLLAFSIANRLDLVTASGTAKVVAIAASISATTTYALSGAVVWPVVLCTTLFDILGNHIGARLAIRNGAKMIRPMFFVVLSLLFTRLAWGVVFG